MSEILNPAIIEELLMKKKVRFTYENVLTICKDYYPDNNQQTNEKISRWAFGDLLEKHRKNSLVNYHQSETGGFL